MAPQQATRLFINEYSEAYKRYVGQVYDIGVARHATGINERELYQGGREYTSFFRARQAADALGVEYRNYLSIAFDFARRHKRQKPPRPNQLTFNGKLKAQWKRKFDAEWPEVMTTLSIRRYPSFWLQIMWDCQQQNRFRDVAMDIAQRRPGLWKHKIEELVVYRRQFELSDFKGIVSDDLISEIRPEIEEQLRKGVEDGQRNKLNNAISMQWQSCFGIPGVQKLSGTPCHECAQKEGCRKLAEVVERLMQKVHGTIDPIKDRKRSQNAERQRHFRQRRRHQMTQRTIS